MEPWKGPGFAFFKLTEDECPDCGGHGYVATAPDGEGHTGAELEVCDFCDPGSDGPAAAFLFVRDLESGNLYARTVARFLIRNGAPAFALEA